jgi:hypothetical protein
MTTSSSRLVRLSWYFGVPGTLGQILGSELLNRGNSAAYPVLLVSTILVAAGIGLVCRARAVSPWWSIIAVLPVVGFLFRQFWLFDRLRGDDTRAA